MGGESGAEASAVETAEAAGAAMTGPPPRARVRRARPGLRSLAFLGPAFVASIAYMDPGNFATNIEGGARYGYLLLWVIVASNLMAMLIQGLSAKLGIATGMSLPEVIRDHAPEPAVWGLWVVAEVVAMATDLAEFLGAALALNLLFGLPMLAAGLLTGVTTFAILGLQRRGARPLEAVIVGFISIIAGCYLVELVLGHPDFRAAGAAVLTPGFDGSGSVLLATGILGATVMPHVIYLHSALTRDHAAAAGEQTPATRRRRFRLETVDIVIAMGIAGLVNAAMLMMAAATLSGPTGFDLDGDIIREAYRTLSPVLGPAAGVLFATALLASGLSSSAVGTMAGQVIMQGFLRRTIPLVLRRLVTMIPALVVIALGVNETRALVLSQVVLSFGIPFALVPLIVYTRRRDVMGDLANTRLTTLVASLFAALIIALNAFLLWQTIAG